MVYWPRVLGRKVAAESMKSHGPTNGLYTTQTILGHDIEIGPNNRPWVDWLLLGPDQVLWAELLMLDNIYGLTQRKLKIDMAGVWVFKQNGVVQLVESPGSDSLQGSARRKVLVHVPTNEAVTSYYMLERILSSLGWERYYDDLDLLQFHKRSTVHLISLPKDFNKLKSMHMYDIVVKNRNMFEVRDM
ncbi:hypothetical protein E3N88_31066 [Mikania micrantha]|uniref:Flowering-promoting factor 1-like protein 3 n=1 Tax=Mikania micrantha TaxID=192012 RepID=A0A5N6MP79_9ASTR|nr:hypothetical protein E3N88_31066 [Mikania micrantha]